MKLCLLLLCAIPLMGNELPSRPLPDAPPPKIQPSEGLYYVQSSPKPVTTGRFLDRPAKAAAIATIGLLAWDSAQTCNNLARGGHEDWLNTQKCGPAVAQLAANKLAFWGGAWIAHKTGHHKIERVCEWLGPAWSAAGIASSRVNISRVHAPIVDARR
jgi:hypothetical protein